MSTSADKKYIHLLSAVLSGKTPCPGKIPAPFSAYGFAVRKKKTMSELNNKVTIANNSWHGFGSQTYSTTNNTDDSDG